MATVPSETTQVAGTVLTAATWNSNVRDAINFLIAPPLAVLKQTTAQSTTSGSWTAILLDSEDIDRDNGHSTTTNTSRYTCQTAGWYHADYNLDWSNASSAGIRGVSHAVNGTLTRSVQLGAISGFTSLSTSAKFYLNVNDYVEMYGIQTSGGALSTQATSYVQIMWIST